MLREQLHASCVEVEGRGILITGASGSGKSSLCAGLIALGARLVADDQVIIEASDNKLIARAPSPIKGLIELYPFGVVPVTSTSAAATILACYDCANTSPERSAEPLKLTICGVAIPQWRVSASYAPLPAQIMLHIQAQK